MKDDSRVLEDWGELGTECQDFILRVRDGWGLGPWGVPHYGQEGQPLWPEAESQGFIEYVEGETWVVTDKFNRLETLFLEKGEALWR